MGFGGAGDKVASRRRLWPEAAHAVVGGLGRQGGGRGGLGSARIWGWLERARKWRPCHERVLLGLQGEPFMRLRAGSQWASNLARARARACVCVCVCVCDAW